MKYIKLEHNNVVIVNGQSICDIVETIIDLFYIVVKTIDKTNINKKQ